MAALLVGMSVAAVLMTAVMPAWRQMARRDDEAELIFRGQQYVRAIALFQQRAGPGVLPPNVDVLLSGRFLRKKYKDPITNQDFDLLSPTAAAGAPGGATAPGGRGSGSAPPQPQGRGFQATGSVIGAQVGAPAGAQPGGRGAGGIIGVASKSKDNSIRIYNGRTHYNEWQFIYVQQAQAPGAGGAGAPGQRGIGPGGTPQRGNQPTPFGPAGLGAGRQGPGAGRGNPPAQPPAGRGSPPSSPSAPSSPPSPFQPRR